MESTHRADVVSASDLKVGDVISDDIACKISAINRFDDGTLTLHVLDGNGWRYMIHAVEQSRFTRFNWSEDEWAEYLAL